MGVGLSTYWPWIFISKLIVRETMYHINLIRWERLSAKLIGHVEWLPDHVIFKCSQLAIYRTLYTQEMHSVKWPHLQWQYTEFRSQCTRHLLYGDWHYNIVMHVRKISLTYCTIILRCLISHSGMFARKDNDIVTLYC